jgi:hypothetical protein
VQDLGVIGVEFVGLLDVFERIEELLRGQVGGGSVGQVGRRVGVNFDR